MRIKLVVTFTGNDKPGLVELISDVIATHKGNWHESRMIQLSGKFCGIVLVGIDQEQVAPLTENLHSLSRSGLVIHVEMTDADDRVAAGAMYSLQMLGLDRPGLVHEISQALAEESINVVEMATDVRSAAMTGEPMFSAVARVLVPSVVNLDSLHDRLDKLSDDLAVDIEISPLDAA